MNTTDVSGDTRDFITNDNAGESHDQLGPPSCGDDQGDFSDAVLTEFAMRVDDVCDLDRLVRETCDSVDASGAAGSDDDLRRLLLVREFVQILACAHEDEIESALDEIDEIDDTTKRRIEEIVVDCASPTANDDDDGWLDPTAWNLPTALADKALDTGHPRIRFVVLGFSAFYMLEQERHLREFGDDAVAGTPRSDMDSSESADVESVIGDDVVDAQAGEFRHIDTKRNDKNIEHGSKMTGIVRGGFERRTEECDMSV